MSRGYIPSWAQPKQKDLDAIKAEFNQDLDDLATELYYLRDEVEELRRHECPTNDV